MKLNLLPTTVARSGQSAGMLILGIAIAAVSVVASVFLMLWSQGNLNKAMEEAQSHQQGAAQALATANAAQTQIDMATVITTNQKLAVAMNEHNAKYPDLYNKVRRYVPSYYRLTSISAQPTGEQATITMVGQLQSFRQYADLAIAMWKVPGVTSVARAGYTLDPRQVPALTEADQIGTPIKGNEAPLPSDPLDRLQELVTRASASAQGFQNVGGFGGADDLTARGAMPGWSTVTMTIVINENIRTPNPRGTIAGSGGAAAGGVPGVGGFGGAGGGPRL